MSKALSRGVDGSARMVAWNRYTPVNPLRLIPLEYEMAPEPWNLFPSARHTFLAWCLGVLVTLFTVV